MPADYFTHQYPPAHKAGLLYTPRLHLYTRLRACLYLLGSPRLYIYTRLPASH